MCQANRSLACKKRRLRTCKSSDRSDCLRTNCINSTLLELSWSFGNGDVAGTATPTINLSDENYVVAQLAINAPPPILVNDIHLHVAVCVAVVGVVDDFSQNFVVEGIVEGKGEHIVERLEYLVFDVTGFYAGVGVKDHFFQVYEVGLVVRVQSLNAHGTLSDVDWSELLIRRDSPTDIATANVYIFIVGEIVGKY